MSGMNVGHESVFLRPEVKVDPLVGRWHAWAHLIAPGPRAMNLAWRFLPLLRSFVANPKVHVAASQDPSMFGGNFVDLREADVPAVQHLIRDTTQQCAPLLEFAREFRNLSATLQESARSASLEQQERELPSCLAGKVELAYDIGHRPQIRLNEELLYRSGLMSSSYEEISLHATPDFARPFILNTPLIDRPDRLFAPVPFADSRLDVLSRARVEAVPLSELVDLLGPAVRDPHWHDRLFTREAPRRNAPHYEGSGVRVRYFGHACVLVQAAGVSVLIDPMTAWTRNEAEASLTFSDLPDRLDYIVLSHGHQDHLVTEMLLQLRARVRTVVVPSNSVGNLADPSLKQILLYLGFKSVVVTDPFDALELPGGSLTSIPFFGEHGGLDIASKQCVLLSLGGRRLLFLVDSAATTLQAYRDIATCTGKADILFIGMECNGAPLSWVYGPLLTRLPSKKEDDSRRISASNHDQAWAAAQAFSCSQAFVYAMGQEPWMRHVLGLAYTPDSIQLTESDRFVASCRSHGIRAERLYGCREMFF